MPPMDDVVFRARNHHAAACGTPPRVDEPAAEKNVFRSYFESERRRNPAPATIGTLNCKLVGISDACRTDARRRGDGGATSTSRRTIGDTKFVSVQCGPDYEPVESAPE